MTNVVELKSPDAQFLYEFDWADQLGEGVTLVSVKHAAPYPLQILEEETDPVAATSLVRIAGGTHGGLYTVSAEATLSDDEVVPGFFTLRVVQPATMDEQGGASSGAMVSSSA